MVFGGLRRAHRSPSPPNGQIADDARLQWGDSLLDSGRLRAFRTDVETGWLTISNIGSRNRLRRLRVKRRLCLAGS